MEETIKLSFEFSKELEVKRMLYTIGRLDWYLSNKYSLDWMSFPRSIDSSKLTNVSKEKIVQAIEEEYDANKYASAEKSLTQLFNPYGFRLKKFIESLGLPVIHSIVVSLTFYGMGGSYHTPNKVVCNISKYSGAELLGNLLHEILHLHIQHLIDKYKIDQWKKETLVNLLFETAFPDIRKENKVPIDTKNVEMIYKENFPNIEKIVSLI